MAKTSPRRGIRMMPRDITGPDDLERRAGSGSTTSRTSGGTRTTRTGTPRTSTNTSAPSRRTSPKKRTAPKNEKMTRKDIQISQADWLKVYQGPYPKRGKYANKEIYDTKSTSPKKSRQMVGHAGTLERKSYKKVAKNYAKKYGQPMEPRLIPSPKQMKDARVASRKGK